LCAKAAVLFEVCGVLVLRVTLSSRLNNDEFGLKQFLRVAKVCALECMRAAKEQEWDCFHVWLCRTAELRQHGLFFERVLK
jgi:hypothetical protein